ncbi:MAG TPA: hypothetical protein VJ949_07765 [Cryomorphaceae bacterium]|nr:hypothetical protein [Cryomorphaceae bacterium]
MNVVSDRIYTNFEEGFAEYLEATPLTKPAKAQKLMSQIDLLSRATKGLEYLYERSLELEEAGLFEDSPWKDPAKQVHTLVKGTLLSGHPSSTIEIMSELRILAYANGRKGSFDYSSEDATKYLEEVVVQNLEFAFDELNEEARTKLTPQERKKVVTHFRFLMDKANLSGIKEKLVEEIQMVCAQRPIVTKTVRNLVQTVYQRMDLDESQEVDQRLMYFISAIYSPGPLAEANPRYDDYEKNVVSAELSVLEKEAESTGKYLHETGLTNPYLAILLRFVLKEHPDLVPVLLKLNGKGKAEWKRHREYVTALANEIFSVDNYLGIYGLKRMLERNLFSRRAVRAGLTNIKLIKMDPMVERRIYKSISDPTGEISAKQYLMGGVLAILGQPLGIGQGNNSTCQSARGISMWAQHSPAKLINMITTVATANNMIMRFENQDLESIKLGKGLVNKLDHALDAVSVILVPHLDKIYNEMMRRAEGRGEDAHKWVNPAMYGQWIPIGFASAYNPIFNSIQDFQGFVKLFYACFHPEYNGGREMVYPNSVGIFVTTSKAELLGFHAVSLLRVALDENTNDYRCYFLNPNNEGRQDWGQGIKPTVFGHGEKYGESSLPVAHFAARAYAYHYNALQNEDQPEKVPTTIIDQITKLAKESWGKAYAWSDIKKQW